MIIFPSSIFEYGGKKINLLFSFMLSTFILISSITTYTYYNTQQLAWGHSILGGADDALDGTQTQRNGNFVVELFLNPSQPLVDENTDIFLRVISESGDELIELPVAVYIFKDGEHVYSNPNNYTLIQQGHYNFNYVFDEPGQYLLFVDVKDIFYTLNVLNFIFEINVDLPITDRIIALLGNYYYVYVPLIIVAIIILTIKLNKTGGLKIKK